MPGIRARFTGNHKSIRGPVEFDLPQFSVLTGRNGTGKSQLLYLLYHGLREPAYGHRREVTLEMAEPLYRNGEVVLEDGRWPIGNSGTNAGEVTNYTTNTWSRYRSPASHGRQNEDHYFDEMRVNRVKVLLDKRELESPDALPTGFFLSRRFELGRLSQELCFTFYHHMIKMLEESGDGASSYSEVVRRSSPPWDSLTELIQDSGIALRCVPPKPRVVAGYQLLFENDSGDKISPMDLSSGERTVVGLAAWLLIAEKYDLIPKVVLLDEADAHLHPSMIGSFVRGIRRLLVERYQCTVVMATHRTETLWCVPQESVFEVHRDAPRIRPSASRTATMELLTDGHFQIAPTRRCVFVEGEPDAKFYTVAARLAADKEFPTQLFFVPISIESGSRSEGGGRAKTEGWVPRLARAGLDDVVVGLVDYDLRQPTTEGVCAIPRYSIENYLLDPIVIYAHLMTRRIAPEVPGVSLSFGQECLLSRLPQETLQKIANCMLDYFSRTPGRTVEIPFETGIVLQYPEWLLIERGKNLLTELKAGVPRRVADGLGGDQLRDAFERLQLVPCDLADVLRAVRRGTRPSLPPWRT